MIIIGILSNSVKNIAEELDIEYQNNAFSYRTGFDLIDYMNGTMIHPKGYKPYYSVGIQGKSIITIIAKSGSGKSTFVSQIAGHIVKKNPLSDVVLIDTEGGNSADRFKKLNKWTTEQIESDFIRLENIDSEELYEVVKKMATKKLEYFKDNQVDTYTGKRNILGEKIYSLPPTVIILDSLAQLYPSSLNEEEKMSGQMSTTAVAKVNSQLFGRLNSRIRKANIILMIVNHVNELININPMVKKQAAVNYLRQDETTPGGNKAIYLSDTLFRLDTSKKFKEEESFGLSGFLVNCTFIKSRTNRAGRIAPLFYSQKHGFNNVISNYLFMKENNLILGKNKYYLKGNEKWKFSQKELLDLYENEPEFKMAFMKTLLPLLHDLAN